MSVDNTEHEFDCTCPDCGTLENAMFDRVMEDYLVTLCESELKIYKSRLLRMDTPTQVYFNSSPLKNAFARVMVISRLQGKPISITQLAHKLLTSRQAIHGIVQDCLENNWIKLVEIRGREKTYSGTSLLISEMCKYSRFFYDLMDKSLFRAHQLVRELSDIHPDYRYEYTPLDKNGNKINTKSGD